MPVATAVVVHAHPDDEAIFTGATIHHLVERGVRVVLVTATSGEAGEPRIPLQRGETIGRRRREELERACDLLGVARLVMLGYQDSGAHRGPYPSGSLGAAEPEAIARRVTAVAEAEQAAAVIHYDPQGIYGHVDHVQVHRAGAQAAVRLGITGYEATVDGAQLRIQLADGGRHLLHAAAGDDAELGVSAATISLAVQASPAALVAKRAAMAAHASQIGPEFLEPERFDGGYGQEWFVRRGPVGLLETHAQGPALR
ncbi:MAG TPA: PIG-L family deacetylase [Kineosporiaceae bacterium]|nr:PIG-L family deacetylase [Kineosporiaceae bacterium]